MKIQGAVIIEQGVTFAIVAVKKSVTNYTSRIISTRQQLQYFFSQYAYNFNVAGFCREAALLRAKRYCRISKNRSIRPNSVEGISHLLIGGKNFG